MNRRSLIAFCSLTAMVTLLAACGGGKSSNNSPPPTAAPSPTPSPAAVSVTTSPAPLTLSVSGAGGVAHSGTVTATQSSATGNISASTTGTPPCYSATPSGSDLLQQTSVTFNYSSSSGIAQLGFTVVALNAGTCTLTLTPASGTPTNVTVTIGA